MASRYPARPRTRRDSEMINASEPRPCGRTLGIGWHRRHRIDLQRWSEADRPPSTTLARADNASNGRKAIGEQAARRTLEALKRTDSGTKTPGQTVHTDGEDGKLPQRPRTQDRPRSTPRRLGELRHMPIRNRPPSGLGATVTRQVLPANLSEKAFQTAIMDLAAWYGWRRFHPRTVQVMKGAHLTPYLGRSRVSRSGAGAPSAWRDLR
jgi:hypothetical protein